jgi:G3E family GTPase
MNPQATDAGRARYVMIGGFLGAGKTSAVARLARVLSGRGLRVGLISNDQSGGLVDTALFRAQGFPVEEIAGGCFCCRFDSLLEAAGKLTRRTRPDVFIAEPVGSCTDLVATVSYPLRRIYGDRFSIAPMSVLVDPHRAARILGLEAGRPFSEKVVYVYLKQLEEADFIVVNKTDALDETLRARLVAEIARRFPAATVHAVSAKEGAGLEPWFDAVMNGEGRRGAAMELDYDAYADGEARLGWLNATARLESEAPFDGNRALLDLAAALRRDLSEAGLEIAHLKMTLEAKDAAGVLSVVSLVRNDGEPDLRESLLDATTGGPLILNLRAEADPEVLERAVRRALEALGAGRRATIEHLERFRPGRPVPTHRLADGGNP